MKKSIKSIVYNSPLGLLVMFFSHTLSLFNIYPVMLYGYYSSVEKKLLRKVRISSSAYITNKKKLVIQDNVWINHHARIDATGGVFIGEGCQIGYGACILSHSSHNSIRLMGKEYMNYPNYQRKGYIFKEVKIGPYSFIGGGSVVMPGVTIGKGCVVGVNSVVTKDLPDYSIAVGNPAKIIGNTQDVDEKYINNDPSIKEYYYNN